MSASEPTRICTRLSLARSYTCHALTKWSQIQEMSSRNLYDVVKTLSMPMSLRYLYKITRYGKDLLPVLTLMKQNWLQLVHFSRKLLKQVKWNFVYLFLNDKWSWMTLDRGFKKYFKNIFLNLQIEQSTGNRKAWVRIPAQSEASFFPQKDFEFFKKIIYCKSCFFIGQLHSYNISSQCVYFVWKRKNMGFLIFNVIF